MAFPIWVRVRVGVGLGCVQGFSLLSVCVAVPRNTTFLHFTRHWEAVNGMGCKVSSKNTFDFWWTTECQAFLPRVTYRSWLGYHIRRAFLMCHLAGAHCGAVSGKGAPAHVIYVQLLFPQLPCLRTGFCHRPSGVSFTFTEGCGFSMSHVPGRLWTERNGLMENGQCEAWRSGHTSQVGSRELLSIINGHLQSADEWSLPMEHLPGGSRVPRVFIMSQCT